MFLSIGERLGPYEIRGAIGAGGMGEVYRAHDPRIGRDVAIKVVAADLASDPERLRRFEQETRAIGLLNHPNILTIHDAGTFAGASGSSSPYIVTELLEGTTLRDVLRAGGLAPRVAIGYAVQIANGLAAAHGRGLVHRDLKPENLFVCADGRIKILDFGIAKLVEPPGHGGETRAATSASAIGLAVGTAGYMSPEQARGAQVDHRSDLFAFGVILHEMLAGVRPFAGATPADAITALLRDAAAPLPEPVRRELPGLEPLVQRCLAKRPDERIQSAQDLAFHLESLTSPQPTLGSGARAASSGWIRPLAIAAVLLAAFVGGWMWLLRAPDEPSVASPAPSPAARVTPFLASDAVETQPAWSPAGNLIAYVSDAAGNPDIWVCDPSGSNPLNVTASHPGVDSLPAWSPDGQRLAFFSDRDGGGLYTMNALGGDVRRVAPMKPGVLYTLSLSWGEGSLVYTNFDADGDKHVYRIAAAGGRPRA